MLFEFIIEKESNSIVVRREFSAGISLVWDAWTKAEILDKWWAPKPWISKTKEMDFRPGGRRLYAMCGPNGEEHWGLTLYKMIDPLKSFHGSDVFCDSEGIINTTLPEALFVTAFHAEEDKTLVVMITRYADPNQLETVIKMGMKEGLTMALDTLEEVLKG